MSKYRVKYRGSSCTVETGMPTDPIRVDGEATMFRVADFTSTERRIRAAIAAHWAGAVVDTEEEATLDTHIVWDDVEYAPTN